MVYGRGKAGGLFDASEERAAGGWRTRVERVVAAVLPRGMPITGSGGEGEEGGRGCSGLRPSGTDPLVSALRVVYLRRRGCGRSETPCPY